NAPPRIPIVRAVAVLAAINPQPYSSNQVPGIARRLSLDHSTAVSTAPANNDGSKPIANRRIGAGRNSSAPPASAARTAATNQTISQCGRIAGSSEMIVASKPTVPEAIPVEPGTASDAADSMDARM